MPAKTNSKKLAPTAQLRSLIDRFDAKNQKFIRSVRAALLKRFPTANELVYDYSSSLVIGYSPSENGIESIVAISARADGVWLYFNRGKQLPDPKKLLSGTQKLTRFMQLESARQLKHPDVEALIAAAIELSKVPLPSKGKGQLIIKTFKADKRPRPRAKK